VKPNTTLKPQLLPAKCWSGVIQANSVGRHSIRRTVISCCYYSIMCAFYIALLASLLAAAAVQPHPKLWETYEVDGYAEFFVGGEKFVGESTSFSLSHSLRLGILFGQKTKAHTSCCRSHGALVFQQCSWLLTLKLESWWPT